MRIFPAPVETALTSGFFPVRKATAPALAVSAGAETAAAFLAREFEAGGLALDRGAAAGTGRRAIVLSQGQAATRAALVAAGVAPVDKAEGYALLVEPERVLLDAPDPAGLLYGAVTLLQMFDPAGGGCRCWRVRDWPHFPYRGTRLHLPKRADTESFKDFVRMLAFLRINHAWFRDNYIRRMPDSVRLDVCRHAAIPDALEKDEVRQLSRFGQAYAVSFDAAFANGNWFAEYFPEQVELAPGEDVRTVFIKGQAPGHPWPCGARFNPCPSDEKGYEVSFRLIDELCEIFPGRPFDLMVCENYQEYSGSRWGKCPQCRDKDPVQLLADYVNRLAGYVIDKGRTPILASTQLVRPHAGYYLNFHRAVDLIRKDMIINNWSEGHIRRIFSQPRPHVSEAQIDKLEWDVEKQHARFMNSVTDVEAEAYAGFKTHEYFRRHGFDKVVHMVGDRWRSRPEVRETRGTLDAHGVYTSYYSSFFAGKYPAYDDDGLERNGLLGELVFTSEHAWSPDAPPMDSAAEAAQLAYAYAAMGALRRGASFLHAFAKARERPVPPAGHGEVAQVM